MADTNGLDMRQLVVGVLVPVNKRSWLTSLTIFLAAFVAAQPIAIVTSDRDSEELLAAIENKSNLEAFDLTTLELPDNKGQILVSQTVLDSVGRGACEVRRGHQKHVHRQHLC